MAAAEASCVWKPELSPLPPAEDLLADFFDFYAHRFDWESEVASIRLGCRSTLSTPELAGFVNPPRRTTASRSGNRRQAVIAVEDPFERRNLSVVVTAGGARRLAERLVVATRLVALGSPEKVLSEEHPSSSPSSLPPAPPPLPPRPARIVARGRADV
eukprot:gnl/TRDRNA2_/TRDRNA2_89812_c0_seq1.p1 gnl/TRDRNA2_/TRDRNA2_89812_c0~~gnl/TRDRNA2_/TRDRNA2_89812_c0_seq1.p1  ORF type:complete len:169 (+),score=33.71 gnl/TRDRNA2_/TRDRNA2_89812_c0_seq1:36-509(+)